MKERDMTLEVYPKRGKATFMGRVVREAVHLTMNMNPLTCKSPLKVMRRLNLLSFSLNYPGLKKEKFTIGDTKFILYSKKGGSHKNCIYVTHGGAYISSLCWLYTRMAPKLSKAGHDADVLFVDYHCAPEYKFPIMVDEAYAGWKWLMEKGYKPENIITLGDSAGGHLQFSLNFRLRENGEEMPKAMVSLSPWIDMAAAGDSYLQNSKVDVMFGSKKPMTLDMIDKLLNSDIFSFAFGHDREDPAISPVYGDYTGFPTTLVISGGDEMLLSDAVTAVQKMKDKGVNVQHIITSGMFHIFPTITPFMKEACDARKTYSKFISEQLTK